MKISYNIIFILLLLIILLKPVAYIYPLGISVLKKGFMSTFPQYQRAYDSSQYVQKKNPGIIPDQTLEAFAGGIFLTGINPILIVHDQPPLGRYIIALSILLFDNTATIPFALYIMGAVGVFFLSKVVLNSSLLALVPFGIFINEQLFLNNFQYLPLLEPLQFPFIVWAIYFFIKASRVPRHSLAIYVITSLLTGCVISIRFFVVGGVLTASFLAYLFLKHRWNEVKKFFITTPFSLLVLVLSYTRTLQLGYSIRQIFGIQKYIFFYHKSALTNPLSYWDLLLFNRWHTWWGTYAISSDPQWFIGWPVSIGVIIIAIFLWKVKKISWSDESQIIFLWILFYSMMLSVGYTSTRYFLPLVPFLYILATYIVVQIIRKFQI